MSPEADQLLEIALKKVGLRDGFCPAELGAKVGLTKQQSETAARALANAGVLVLGFDQSAEFSADFRRSRVPAPEKPLKLKLKKPTSRRAKRTAAAV